MARVQDAALRAGASDAYTDEQLSVLLPADRSADAIPRAEFVGDDRESVVAERDGAVVGWGSVRLDRGVLAATFVDPEWAREGIGRAIVQRLEAEAREAGLDALGVHASPNAVEFYETLGYERQGAIDAGGPGDPDVPAFRLEREL